ncbi:MAG: hypothetical protein VYA17_12500 [Pseudomonadota bacterium]|nr:hypothetical protein [Pseudomonadota bacterium]
MNATKGDSKDRWISRDVWFTVFDYSGFMHPMTSIFATVENTRVYFLVAALLAIAQLWAAAARSSDTEAFKIATNYTVKIKASVRYPFIGDRRAPER